MRRCIAAISTISFAISAAAQLPQQCVNPSMLNGLVFLGNSQMKISVSQGEPAFMQGQRLPRELQLIGSGVRESGVTTVAYKTALTVDQAYAALADAMGAQGWMAEAAMGSTFNVASGPKEGTLCRDGERRHVLVHEVAGTRYINVMASQEARRRECNANTYMSLGMDRSALPRLLFPAGTSVAQGSGGGGGSNTMYNSVSRIISAQAPASLVEHLASQIAQQGWQPDAGWQGAASAGSTWTKTIDGAPARGTLEIVRVSEGTYDVDFTIVLP